MTCAPHDRQVAPLLAPDELDRLRTALADYTVDTVGEALGPRGKAALDRSDLAGAARALRGADHERAATLTRLFLLGGELDEAVVRRALGPLSLDAACAAGIVRRSATAVRASLEIRPYAEDGAGAPPWWVVSDLGADVRPGALPSDHVLGIGAASATLAQATPRGPVERALDIGTGCGVQALHLSRHARSVSATDVSPKALRYASTTAALAGLDWDLRHGSLLEPVVGDRFDLVVANPPFVVSPGGSGLDYRDSGLAGDAVCERLVRGLPDVLTPDGTAVILANWIVRGDEDWSERLGSWLDGHTCDAWAWQREVAGPEEYVSLWLRDAGLRPGDEDWSPRYDAWCDWFENNGVVAVGMGLVALFADAHGTRPVRVFDDVSQALEAPIGDELPRWLARARWLRDTDDGALRSTRLRPASGLVRTRADLLGDSGWRTATTHLRQSHAMRWEVAIDEATTALVAGCASGAPLGVVLDLLASSLDVDQAGWTAAALPTVRDLIGRGFLEPAPHDGVGA